MTKVLFNENPVFKASAEKQFRALNAQLNDINKKVEEASLNLADMENGKRRITSENGDLLHQLQELQEKRSALLAQIAKCDRNIEYHERLARNA